MLAEHFNFELDVHLELLHVVQFAQHSHQTHDPRIRRPEHTRVLGALHDFGHKRSHCDEPPRFEALAQKLFQVELALQDRLVPRESHLSEPRPEVLEERALRSGRGDLLGREQHRHVVEHRHEHGTQQLGGVELQQKGHVECVEVGLRADPLHHHVVPEPRQKLGLEHAARLRRLLLQVLQRHVVEHEVDALHDVVGGRRERQRFGAGGHDVGHEQATVHWAGHRHPAPRRRTRSCTAPARCGGYLRTCRRRLVEVLHHAWHGVQ
mmetsp:Transcript_34897/g.69346  ORF Transcript_34897/g.69346 Transcript_34897/m.69346 type:complete len:265 (-) Transcript_34897:2898-3692(-)